MKVKEKYDLEGYDISGYNEEGWNRKNINKTTGAKYDTKGYDRFGYDKNGDKKEKNNKVKKSKKKIFIIPVIILIGFLIFYFRGTLKTRIESEYRKISRTVKNERIGSEILELRANVIEKGSSYGIIKKADEEIKKEVIKNSEKNFVFVRGGTFVPTFSKSQITLKNFYMNKYEVTQKEYKSLMGYNPSWFRGEKKPVENVTWINALEYANALSKKQGLTPVYKISRNNLEKIVYADGKGVNPNQADFSKTNGYRLPTEAEWEFAARSGNLNENRKYVGSNNVEEVAIYHKNSPRGTQNVGTKRPNRFGIYDMSGNVWEWTYDSWIEGSANITDSKPYIYGNKGFKRVRGGSWNRSATFVELAYRGRFEWNHRGYQGIRLVRSI